MHDVKLCKTSFYPQFSGKTFIRLVQAQIIFKHMKAAIPVIKDPGNLYTVHYCGTKELEEAIQKDVNYHLPRIFESNYKNTMKYLAENGLCPAPLEMKELDRSLCSTCISTDCQFHPKSKIA